MRKICIYGVLILMKRKQINNITSDPPSKRRLLCFLLRIDLTDN